MHYVSEWNWHLIHREVLHKYFNWIDMRLNLEKVAHSSRASFNLSLPAGSEKSMWFSKIIWRCLGVHLFVLSVDRCLWTYFFIMQVLNWHFRKLSISISIKSKYFYFQGGILGKTFSEIWIFPAGNTLRPTVETNLLKSWYLWLSIQE